MTVRTPVRDGILSALAGGAELTCRGLCRVTGFDAQRVIPALHGMKLRGEVAQIGGHSPPTYRLPALARAGAGS